MNLPLVSICIPTYNSEKYLEETLNSIISQTYHNIEIIIGDNGSSDNTLSIIKEYFVKDNRITFYSNENNIGYSRNCNKLISKAKGEFVSIFHSDDVYDPSIIEKEVKILKSNPQISGVFTSFYKITEVGSIIPNVQYPITSNENLLIVELDEYLKGILRMGASCFCCPTSMIRKNVYLSLNGYDENLKYIEDQDMWARILLNGSLGILNQKLIKYRIHQKQESKIYSDRSIDNYSIPLEHILHFIKKNSLTKKYEQEIAKAEAFELIHFSRLAIIENNYLLFIEKLKDSKKKYSFSLKTKHGLIQNFPIPRLIYLLTKILY